MRGVSPTVAVHCALADVDFGLMQRAARLMTAVSIANRVATPDSDDSGYATQHWLAAPSANASATACTAHASEPPGRMDEKFEVKLIVAATACELAIISGMQRLQQGSKGQGGATAAEWPVEAGIACFCEFGELGFAIAWIGLNSQH